MEKDKKYFDKLLAELLSLARSTKNNVLYGALSGCSIEGKEEGCVFTAPTETSARFVKNALKEENFSKILEKFNVTHYEVQKAQNKSDGIEEDINALQELFGESLRIE